MEAVFAALLGSVLFMHAWQMFGLSDRKTSGIVGLVGALGLASLALFKPVPMLTKVEAGPFTILLLTWATYSTLIAATGLWDFDLRGFGFWSILGAVTGLAELGYSAAVVYNLKGIIEGILLAIAFAVLFFYLGMLRQGMRLLAAWVFLIVSIVFLLIAILVVFKVPGLY
ncbi:MAG: hypothetical protein M1531_06400 [Chloroflexi bacterium]|nr:hypothetical protein [Chloroflexota bacterium]